MNKGIFELAKQADLIEWDILPSGARTPDHESVVKAQKFAELIVKECIKEIGYKSVDLLDIDFYPHYQERLKKHFGVEE